MDDCQHDWMATATGRQFFPTAPAPESVDITDIAHHLSHVCRFAGATSEFYSVAEHSIWVSFVCNPADDRRRNPYRRLLHGETRVYPLFGGAHDRAAFDRALRAFLDGAPPSAWQAEPFLRLVAAPLLRAHRVYTNTAAPHRYEAALRELERCAACDWRTAAAQWVERHAYPLDSRDSGATGSDGGTISRAGSIDW